MAIYYIDNINGSDANSGTTGSEPWKTINKGLQNSVNGDEVRVAGGSFSALPGFLSFRVRGATCAVSADWTARGVTAGSTLAFDTSAIDGWPLEYSLFQVGSITPTVLTFVAQQGLATKDGTYSCWFFNSSTASQYHYATSSTVAQQIISSFTASEVRVLGGWDPTFTTRWGWTGAKNNTSATAQTAQQTNQGSLINFNFVKPRVIFDKFLCVNTGFSSGSANGAHGFATMSFLNNISGAPMFGNSNYGIAGPTAGSAGTIILNNTNGAGGGENSWNGGGNPQPNHKINYWVSCQAQQGGGTNAAAFYLGYTNTNDYSSDFVKWRSNGSFAGTQYFQPFTNGRYGKYDLFEMFIAGSASFSLSFNSQGTLFKELKVNKVDNSTAGIGLGNAYETPNNSWRPITLKYNGIFEDLPLKQFTGWGTNPGYIASAKQWLLTTQLWNITDNEGTKVGSFGSFVYFADSSTYSTGSQSMRIKMLPTDNISSTRTVPYIIGFTPRPTTATFSLSITARTNNPTPLSVVPIINYNDNQINSSGELTLTTTTFSSTWRTYSYSVNTASLTTWSWSDQPLAIGFTCLTSNISQTASIYTWIGEVKIS